MLRALIVAGLLWSVVGGVVPPMVEYGLAVSLHGLLIVAGAWIFRPGLGEGPAHRSWPSMLAWTWAVGSTMPSDPRWPSVPVGPMVIGSWALASVLLAQHVSSHTRPGTGVGLRARADALMSSAVLGAAIAWGWVGELQPTLVRALILPAGVVGLWGIVRLLTLGRDLDPGQPPLQWSGVRRRVRRRDAALLPAVWTHRFSAGPTTATLRICRDPIPPWTEIELPLPALRGVQARAAPPGGGRWPASGGSHRRQPAVRHRRPGQGPVVAARLGHLARDPPRLAGAPRRRRAGGCVRR